MKDDMKVEMEAGRNIQLDHIKEMLAKNDMVRQNEEMVKMITKLQEQNARLQSELDKAIHQLKDYEKALKEYAKYEPCEIYIKGKENPDGTVPMKKEIVWAGKLAVETLKKWE